VLGSHLIIKSAVSAIILVAEAGSIMTERHNSNNKAVLHWRCYQVVPAIKNLMCSQHLE